MEKYITFTKKAGKFNTEIDPVELDARIEEIKDIYTEKDTQIDTIHKEQADLDKELRSLEFIKSQLK